MVLRERVRLVLAPAAKVPAEEETLGVRYVERGRCPADDTLAEFLAAASVQEEPCPAIA